MPRSGDGGLLDEADEGADSGAGDRVSGRLPGQQLIERGEAVPRERGLELGILLFCSRTLTVRHGFGLPNYNAKAPVFNPFRINLRETRLAAGMFRNLALIVG